MEFRCTYCGRKKKVSLLEFKANALCNTCFDERASTFVQKNNIELGVIDFWGIKIQLNPEARTKNKHT